MDESRRSRRVTVRRLPERARYDRKTIHAILDEGLVCHVGFAVDGDPYVIPMAYGRSGDTLYLHGATSSRLVRVLRDGLPVCVTVTLLDGLVLARSAFHHSVNYRSVVVLGTSREIAGDEKVEALRAVTDHMAPGRWDELRSPLAQELRATSVLAVEIDEASAKVRTGPPKDDPADLAAPVWAGVVPLHLARGRPIADGVSAADPPAG